MGTFTKFWKVWLKPNFLTKDVDNDYIAEVSTEKNTLRNEDISQRIVNEGSEIKYDTILSIIRQRDRIVRENLLLGFSVLTDVCQFTPRVLGSWIGSSAKFDPAIHKLTLDIILAAAMRKDLESVGVEVLGVKDNIATIGLVTDTLTGKTDGSITINDDILIDGNKIKVVGEGEEIGVFFVASDATVTKVTRRLTQNDPKTLIARVPALADGTYTLRIVTRFTSGNTLLKEPRTIEYERPLTVGAGGGAGGDDDRPVIE